MRSLLDLLDQTDLITGLLAFAGGLLGLIGLRLGWMHGAFRLTMLVYTSLLVLVMLPLDLGGKRRLTAALTARDAARHAPP